MKSFLRLEAVNLLLTGSAFALTGECMPEMTLDQMTPAQRSVAEAIIHGARGRMRGPFNSWLRSRVICRPCGDSAVASRARPDRKQFS